MPWIVARIDDGRLRASRWDRNAFDQATEVQFEADEMPDIVAQRWDGATGFRAATPAERESMRPGRQLSTDAAALIAVLAPKLGETPEALRTALLAELDKGPAR
jgi:hypothetical protein